jgi:hypothetical protein
MRPFSRSFSSAAVRRAKRARPVSPRGRPRVRLVAPIAFNSARRAAGDSKVSVTCSMSITGSAKPAATSMSPMSCMSTKRFVCVAASMPANARRNSPSVSGPNVVNVNSPPTFSTRRTSPNARGRSFTHCSARLLQTRSALTPRNGSAFRSAQTKRGAFCSRAGRSGASRRSNTERCARARRRAASTIGSATSNATMRAPG